MFIGLMIELEDMKNYKEEEFYICDDIFQTSLVGQYIYSAPVFWTHTVHKCNYFTIVMSDSEKYKIGSVYGFINEIKWRSYD